MSATPNVTELKKNQQQHLGLNAVSCQRFLLSTCTFQTIRRCTCGQQEKRVANREIGQ